MLADPQETWARSAPVLPLLREAGWAAALVAQDGLGVNQVPWEELDTLFIGGTTDWKLSEAAYGLVRAAAERGVPAHVGRVNSLQRLTAFAAAGATSADGTCLAFGPDRWLPLFARALRKAADEPGLAL